MINSKSTKQQIADIDPSALYSYMKAQGIASSIKDESGDPVYILRMGDESQWLFSDGTTKATEKRIEYPWNQPEIAP